MCGICGYISKNSISNEALRNMNDTMIHRGPDDSGVETYEGSEGYTVGFAHRRLSILDLSSLGHQPMHSKKASGTTTPRVSIVYNGEIFNYLEIKEEIKEYQFESTCDTEVIIASYLKWGKACFDKFNGMFAIALYDRETHELILARDRIGKKPLYYWYDSKNLVFASELKPIMAHPEFRKSINENVLSRYLFQQYINSPDTVFQNVYKLEPGMLLTFKSGEIKKDKYWSIREKYYDNSKLLISNYDEAKSELKRLLTESVKRRMIADVPLGTFLSGGYDSSLITALAQSVSDKPVKTFTIGFEDKKYNEAEFARDISNHLGTEHTERYISEKDMYELVDSIPQFYDEPMADSSQIPSMLVAKLAKEKVTVALSGDGGDEFYCGYNIYGKLAKAQKLDFLGGVCDGAFNILKLKDKSIYEKIPFQVRAISENRNKLAKTQLSSSCYDDIATRLVVNKNGLPNKYEVENSYNTDNWQIKRMLLDMETYLPEDILCKVDRASMKYSLECRCPILDKDVMEYSFRLPHKYKFNAGNKKYILKDIIADYIPRELLDRPKRGFSVPLDKWLRGPLKSQMLDFAGEDYIRHQGLFDPGEVNAFFTKYLAQGDGGPSTGQNYSRICWAFFMFQKWYDYYMK